MRVYAKMRRFQDGGTAYAGLDPNDPRNQGFGSTPGSTGFVAPTPKIAGPAASNYTPPDYSSSGDPKAIQLSNQRSLLGSQQAQIGPSQAYLDAMGLVYNAQGQLVPVKQAALNAQGNVLSAVAGTFGPQGQYIDAQGHVIDAQAAQNAGNRAYIGQEGQANLDRIAAENRIQAAHANTADQAAVGQAKTYEGSTDYLYGMGGVAKPADVIDRNGAPLPSGTRPALETQEQVVTDQEKQKENLRALQLEGARLVVALLGTDVQAAQEEAARVGLTVDQAQLLVKEAENQANRANLDVRQGELNIEPLSNAADLARLGQSQAELNTRALGISNNLSELPPRSGLSVYTDPFTGDSRYMTPAEAEIQRQQDAKLLGNGSTTGTTPAPKDTSGQTETGYLQKLSAPQIVNLYGSGQLGRYLAMDALIEKGYTAGAAKILLDQEDASHKKAATGTSTITFGPGD